MNRLTKAPTISKKRSRKNRSTLETLYNTCTPWCIPLRLIENKNLIPYFLIT